MKHITFYLFFSLLLVIGGLQAKPLSKAEQQLQIYQELKAENLIPEWQFQKKTRHLLTQIKSRNYTVQGVGTAEINGQILSGSIGVNGAQVSLYNVDGQNFIQSQSTSSTGTYAFTNLIAGNYYIAVNDQVDDYIDAIWTSTGTQYCDYFCQNLPPESIINLGNGMVSSGHDLHLTIGATFTGKMIDASTGDQVDTLDVGLVKSGSSPDFWNLVNAVQYDGLGNYSVTGIPGGTYQVFLDRYANTMHIPEVYNGIQCNICSISAMEGIGEPVTLTNGATQSGIDFSLEIGAKIQGFLVDAISFNPLEDPGVIILTSDNGYHVEILFLEGTDWDPSATGAYLIGGLLPGTYFAEGSDSNPNGFHMRELYSDRPCPYSGCDRLSGTPITLGLQEHRGGINFLLDHGGNISGNVSDAISGLPFTAEQSFVQFYDMSGKVAGGANVNPLTGDFTSSKALPAGVYSARTGNMFTGDFTPGYIMEKYEATGNIDCPGVTCDLTTVNIIVNAYDPLSDSLDPEGDATTTNIDFALNTGLGFSGTITDLSTTLPLEGVHVLVYDDRGLFAHWATTDNNGYFTVSGLPAGTYYAKTNNGSKLPFPGIYSAAAGTWVDILYNGISCPGSGCDVTTGTPIVLGGSPDAGQKGGPQYLFSLPKGGTLSGRLIHSETTVGVSNVDINVYNSQGDFYGSYESNSNGYWTTSGFPADTYYLITQGRGAMVDVKFGGDYCFNGLCDPLTADPIMLGGTYNITGVNMVLKPDYIFRSGLD